jgi:putative peptide zinc metalloprotease protein
LARLLAGVTLEQPRLLAEPGWPLLWAYGLAAIVYRTLVLVAILWLVHAALAPRGLAVVAQLVTALTLAAVVAAPATGIVRWLSDPTRRKQLRPRRLVLAALVLAALAGAILLVPLPSRVTAPVVFRPQHARRIYVTTPGRLVSAAAPGSAAVEGQEIGRLQSPTLERQVVELTGRTDAQRLHLAQLQLRRHDDESLGDQLPAAAKLLADLEAQLSQQRRELARLTLTAPIAGTVLPPPARPEPHEAGELATYAGTPLDEPNRGCHLEAGILVCLIGDPARLEGVAIIDEAEVQRVRAGQRVRLRLDELPGRILAGQVADVSRLNSDELPPEITARQLLPQQRRPDGSVQTTSTYFEAVIAVDPHAAPLLMNATGWARIEAAPQPLWLHLYRSLRSTFHLAL